MLPHTEPICRQLAQGPLTARQLGTALGLSQPSISRALAAIGETIVRIGSARSIQYALRDMQRGLPDTAVYRIDVRGQISQIGTLIPVRPDGFVMQQSDGKTLYSEGLPWWIYDMRPQGYLGRAYASRHGHLLGLPHRLADWSDTHALHALIAHGHDMTGNLLLGEQARLDFLSMPAPTPIPLADKLQTYARLARDAALSDLPPGSSAAGEQPKFTAYALTPDGPRHVIVKFSEHESNAVSQRWQDLLLAEHLALETLREAGVPAARSRIIDHDGQRFLEVERFDRVDALGRRGVISLAALDAEFVGASDAGWPRLVQQLAQQHQIQPEAAHTATLLWAFGSLIGNTDMHNGNLSFVTEHGRPYTLAPAYDMTPMAFSPRSGGGLPNTLQPANLQATVSNDSWHRAASLAEAFMRHVEHESASWHPHFNACIAALRQHVGTALERISRLG